MSIDDEAVVTELLQRPRIMSCKLLVRGALLLLLCTAAVVGVTMLIILQPTPQVPVPTLYKNDTFAEVFRISPFCLSRGDTMREGHSFGWFGNRPVRYGIWHILVSHNTSNIFINVGRTLWFETREEAQGLISHRDTNWCTYAHANGYTSIQIRQNFQGRSEMIMCDDANNRDTNIGPCAFGPYFTRGASIDTIYPCECSDIMNVLNCAGEHAQQQSCSDATHLFDHLSNGG